MLVIDELWGEPPSALHPTVWMGRMIATARTWHRAQWHESGHDSAHHSIPGSVHGFPGKAMDGWSRTRSFMAGAATLAIGAWATASFATYAQRMIARVPQSLQAPLSSGLLKPALSLRALLDASRCVERALRRGNLPDARRLLAWHLVSRPTTDLTPAEVAGATIESLSENLSDSVVAPLLYHALGGLAAAYVYRFVNTADAMVGYRTAELEWFGKPAARVDDALNFLPARLTAALIAIAAGCRAFDATSALRCATRDARRTPSVNAGWPMAAMAGALGVRLDKRATRSAGSSAPALRSLYVLNRTGRAPTVADIADARRIVHGAAMMAAHMFAP